VAVQHITCMIIDNLHMLATEEGAVMDGDVHHLHSQHAIGVETGHSIDRNGISYVMLHITLGSGLVHPECSMFIPPLTHFNHASIQSPSLSMPPR
jgi:hypothetical protein